MKPALTAEEWMKGLVGTRIRKLDYGDKTIQRTDDWGSGFLVSGDTVNADSSGGEYSGVEFPRHALAALCLHGQPYGFTHGDVDLLREAAVDLPYSAFDGDGTIARKLAASYESLADRIEALLPPEAPNGGKSDAR